MLKDKSEAIGKAVDVLEYLSQDVKAREEYEFREKGIRDYNSAISSATQEGKIEGSNEKAIEVAKKGLENNVPIETIVLMTGLSEKEVEQFMEKE